MKVLLLILAVAASCLPAAHGQGTVLFSNHLPGGSAPVYMSDRVTALSGSQFLAELLGGSSPDHLDLIATTGFGPSGGYFDGGVQALNTVVPGNDVWVEVRVWNTASGDSFLQAQASGLPDSWWASSTFSVQTGGNFSGIPHPPGFLMGLGHSPVYLNPIPEPSTFALAGVGATLALLRARRCRQPNQPRQSTPGERLASSRAPMARRGCALRSAI